MKPLRLLSLSLLAAPLALSAAEKAKPNPAQIEAQTRLQIFLDRANFGPGKLDGRAGEFTQKALALYRQANSLPAAPAAKPDAGSGKAGDAPTDISGLDLSGVEPVFTSYTLTAEDLANVGDIPESHAAQAKTKSMPYRSVLELVAEKFHSDVDFIKELNPAAKADALKEGGALTVPNVTPFELAAVKSTKPGEALAGEKSDAAPADEEEKSDAKKKGSSAAAKAGGKADEEKISNEKPEKKTGKTDAAGKDAEQVKVHVSVAEKMLEVRQGERLVAAFPVTPGSDAIPSPVGEWKVKTVAKMPDFRYDEKMLKEGVRSSDAFVLPPGPNNPVGIAWIALNKDGIGMHGTDDPDTIGRAASHGCIRLANWDVAKLLGMVKSGVPVTIE